MNARGPVVIVTGAGGGIGTAVVRRFAEGGGSVVAADLDLSAAEAAISELPDSHRAMGVDVTDEQSVAKLVGSVIESEGSIDTVVHAAGILGDPDMFTTSVAEWDRVFDVNTRGTFLVLRSVAEEMKRGQGGCFVALASVAAKEARHDYVAYNASKAAVLNMVWSAALTLAPLGVRVNALCPGPVATPMWEQVAGDRGEPGSAVKERMGQIPLGRFATPADVAEAAFFLASPAGSYITGVSLDVAGGARLGMGS